MNSILDPLLIDCTFTPWRQIVTKIGAQRSYLNNVELANANYQTIKILNTILSTFNFHTQLVHTFVDFIHRCYGNMPPRTNTKFRNRHTLHIHPVFLILENSKHGYCYIYSTTSLKLYLCSRRWNWIHLLLQQNKVKKKKQEHQKPQNCT